MCDPALYLKIVPGCNFIFFSKFIGRSHPPHPKRWHHEKNKNSNIQKVEIFNSVRIFILSIFFLSGCVVQNKVVPNEPMKFKEVFPIACKKLSSNANCVTYGKNAFFVKGSDKHAETHLIKPLFDMCDVNGIDESYETRKQCLGITLKLMGKNSVSNSVRSQFLEIERQCSENNSQVKDQFKCFKKGLADMYDQYFFANNFKYLYDEGKKSTPEVKVKKPENGNSN